MQISLSDPLRGSVEPTRLWFDPGSWSMAQTVVLTVFDTGRPASIGIGFFIALRGEAGSVLEGQVAAVEVPDQRRWDQLPGGAWDRALQLSSIPYQGALDTSAGQYLFRGSCPSAAYNTDSAELWMQFTVPASLPLSSAYVNITMCDSFFDTEAMLLSRDAAGNWKGQCNDDWTSLSANPSSPSEPDYSCALNLASSRLLAPVTPGSTYFILVRGIQGTQGRLTLEANYASASVVQQWYPWAINYTLSALVFPPDVSPASPKRKSRRDRGRVTLSNDQRTRPPAPFPIVPLQSTMSWPSRSLSRHQVPEPSTSWALP